MSEDQIVKFDPAQFASQLKDKIRLDIAQFLPEDEWKRLIEAEVKGFLEGRWEKEDYYRDRQRYYPSGLRLAVLAVMEAETTRFVKEYMGQYQNYGGQVANKVDEVIAQNIEGLVRAALGPFLQRVFNGQL
jgi:hypothetical protein